MIKNFGRRRRQVSQIHFHGMPLISPDHFAIIAEGEPLLVVGLNDLLERFEIEL